MQVFISYSRPDARLAEEVARALRERHFDPWLDEEIPAGDDFSDAIEAAAARADGLLFLVDAASAADKRQKKEWHSAVRAQ